MVVPVLAIKVYRACDSIAALLSTALSLREWSAKGRDRFTLKESIPGTHLLGDWVGPKIGLDILEDRKSLAVSGLEPRVLQLVV